MKRYWLRCMCVLPLLMSLASAQEPDAKDKPVRVACHGKLRDGVVAIGGESTGTTLRFRGITWELQFKDTDGQAFAQAHHKKPVSVTGTLRRVLGVERGARWIVDVEQYAATDPDKREEGATITLTGTLARDPEHADRWLFESGKSTYPVQLPADAKVRPGQPVTIEGAVEALEQTPSPQPPFVIRATKVDVNDDAPPAPSTAW